MKKIVSLELILGIEESVHFGIVFSSDHTIVVHRLKRVTNYDVQAEVCPHLEQVTRVLRVLGPKNENLSLHDKNHRLCSVLGFKRTHLSRVVFP